MSTITRPPGTGEALVEAAIRLAPAIAARAADIEAGRRIPRDLLDDLVAAGCFRALLPTSRGGLGVDLPTAARALQEIGRADGSAAWTVLLGSAAWLDLVGLPRATFDALYADGPDVLLSGVFSPSGVASRTDGGYRVSGRWAFATGSSHCDWFFGNCLEDVDGEPALRTVLFRADEVQIEDTWHVLGLRGTASNHVSVDGAFVPEERTFATFDAPPAVDDPIVDIPVPSLAAIGIGSVAIGIAQGALDDIVGAAAQKLPLLASTSLADQPGFQRDLASADTEVSAARALVESLAASTWATVTSGDALSLAQRAHLRAAGVWTVERAIAVVQAAYRAGGGGAVYDDSSLQRRLRDVETLAQHFLVRLDTLTTAGAVLTGHEVDVPVF